MANIDVTTIQGFDGMTAEQKVEALLKFDIPERIDMSKYVSKETACDFLLPRLTAIPSTPFLYPIDITRYIKINTTNILLKGIINILYFSNGSISLSKLFIILTSVSSLNFSTYELYIVKSFASVVMYSTPSEVLV